MFEQSQTLHRLSQDDEIAIPRNKNPQLFLDDTYAAAVVLASSIDFAADPTRYSAISIARKYVAFSRDPKDHCNALA